MRYNEVYDSWITYKHINPEETLNVITFYRVEDEQKNDPIFCCDVIDNHLGFLKNTYPLALIFRIDERINWRL